MPNVKLGPFTGINNVDAANTLKVGELMDAENVNLSNKGEVTRRGGWTLYRSGAAHSPFSFGNVFLFRAADKLLSRSTDGTERDLIAGLGSDRMSYAAFDGAVYMSDGKRALIYKDGVVLPWGISPPSRQPSAALMGGMLPQGAYQYAMTFLRADGEESGTGVAAKMTAFGGIQWTGLEVSQDPSVLAKALYITLPNGKVLYRATVVSNASLTASYAGDTLGLSVKLETQFKQPPPPGNLIAEHNGRMLVAAGDFLMFSDPYRPQRFDPIRQSYRFLGPIALLASVQGGVFVSDQSGVSFYVGLDIESATPVTKTDYRAFGSVRVNAASVVSDREGMAVLAASKQGLCCGFDDGSFINLTDNRYETNAVAAAGVIQRASGADRCIFVLTQ